jgi:two-component system phosphate regulon sensor histidine kinase PhoR
MDLSKLAALVKQDRQGLLARWRVQVRKLSSARDLDTPTLNDHIPGLIEELIAAFEAGSARSIPDALHEDSAQVHGLQRLKDAFDIEEVVAEYNILRGCVHDLANDHGFNLQGVPFHILNQVFDHAIGMALQTYASQRALEVQQRREDYLSFVAHDLQTPLFAISLAGRVLERTLPNQGYDPTAAQMLKALGRSVAQLEGLVRLVLEENSNLGTDAGVKLVRREFDLWPLVEALNEEFVAVADASGTRLLNEVPQDLVVFADAGLLKRVLQNLVANATRYAPHGEVAVGALPLGAAGDEGVECWVRDNGAGIPADVLGSIFEKGESGPGHADGTGLGLAIVQMFTEAHGGRVSVESREGKGSTFRFSLPAKARP